MLQLDQKLFVTGYFKVETGLCIGGPDRGFGLGGADVVVVRNPLTLVPYLPGSTLKGRMRSLLERLAGEFGPSIGGSIGGPIRSPKTDAGKAIGALFGVPAGDRQPIPGRLQVRDGSLLNAAYLDTHTLDLPYTEVKTEVTIDRITARTTPRYYERVPAGAVFALDCVLSCYTVDGTADDPQALCERLFAGLRLVQDDALGGASSRGYGKVSVHVTSPLTARSADAYLSGAAPEALSTVSVPGDLQFAPEVLAEVERQCALATIAPTP